ncbi:PAS domain-containing protein [uncultured Hymenobacter sp.]|uniref:PAS domain-containing protein n=1 Tax=uncultured Hymenobacter sp. TaxID=170016 RepID=UPI0035CC7F70
MPDSIPAIDYRALFHRLPDSFLLLAPDGTVLDNTDAHVQVSLLPRAQAVGRSIFAAYPSEAQGQRELAASLTEVRRTRQPHVMDLLRYDLARPAEQGGGTEERYWQASHFPLLDARGELQYILQRTQDVTAATLAAQRAAQVEQALDEEQDRTRFILENLPVMIWTSTAEGVFDYYNARWQAYTGQTAQTGRDWQAAQLVHPDDEARVAREISQAVAAGREYQVEFRLRRHDGQYRWMLGRNVPRFDADGRVTMWIGGGIDVHDQKTMVQELLDTTEQQAALSEQSYQIAQQVQQQRGTLYNLFMQAPASIAIVRGPEYRYEFVNPSYQAALGNRELLGRPALEAVPELGEMGLASVLDEVYRTGEPYHAHEVPLAFDEEGSGTRRTAYFTYVIQRFEENGQPAGITSYAYDVTELVEARHTLRRLAGEGAASFPG